MTRVGPVDRAPLFGRTTELEAISAFLATVPAGGAELVIEGEPGIGKSALFDATLAEASARGQLALVSRPSRADASVPFSGLSDLLFDVVEEINPGLPEPQRRAIEVALMLRASEGEPPSPLAIALAVRGALRGLAESSPLLVAIDDAQWLDDPSAAALGHAIRRLGASPVGVLSVWQPGGAPGAHLRNEGDGSSLRPAPLAPPDVDRLLKARLGLSLKRGLLDRVHRTSRGNPMAALTLGRGILESGDDGSPGGPLPVPSDLAGILRAQLARTSAEVLDVLLVVAVAADPSVALVEAVGGPGSRPAMERAIAEGVVIVEDGALRFTHALFGLVLEADADQDRLRRLHAQLAEVVQAPEERAMHLARSILDPDPAVASQLEEAARGVRARGAPSTAADLCERARLLTPADRPEDLVRRSLLESECRLEAGELPQSRALLEGLVESAPPGPARAAALQRLGWVRYHQDSWPSASDLFRRAAAEAESEPTLRASVELDRAVACQVSGDLLGAAAHAREAAERSVDLDDAAFAADAAAMVASVEFLLGRGIADDALERAVAAETWSRARPTAARPSVAYGVLLKWSDRFEASRSRLESALARTEEKGSERSLPFILFHLAEVECWMGDLDRAGSHAARASEVAAGSDQEGGRGFALAAQALVQAHRGQESEARDTATRGLDVATRTGAIPAAAMLSSVLGFLELSLGRPAAAHRHLGPLMASADSEGIAEPGAARYLGDGLEALIGVGELEVAERVTADLERRSEELDRAWGSLVAYRATGLVRAAEGDLGGARDALEVALLHAGRIAHPMELGRTLLVQGSIERRDRQKRSARLTLERSLEVFSGLGAELWIERCRSELSRIGGRQPAGLALSPTEERVARMAAEGATNQEIAAAQFLSVRTVEWHLSRVYRKLGLRSKVELARWFGANQHPAT